MKIRLLANQLVDGEVEYVSLVKNGANRSPFKIVKEEGLTPGGWEELMPELAKLKQRIAEPPTNTDQETTEMMTNEDEVRKLEIAKLRQRLASLNHQQLNLWESPQHPLFAKLDADLTYEIERCELELAVLSSDQQDQMKRSSAFFRRGGTSTCSQATVYDSADERHGAPVQKSMRHIELSTPITRTDEEAAAKIDLTGIYL